MRSSARALLPVVLAVLAAMEILALSGAVPAPHLVLSPGRVSPFMAGVLAVPFLLLLRSSPRRIELAGTLGIAALIGIMSAPGPRPALLAAYALGLASLAVMALRALATRGEARERAVDGLAEALVLPAFFMSMVTGLGLTVLLHPATMDGALFHADASIFGAPSFAVGRAFAASPALAQICETVYRWLPLAAGVLLALPSKSASPASRERMLATFVASGILGFAVYHLVPATGPQYAFRGRFPASVPALAEVPLSTLVPPFDRNCVPSLHTTWALFLLWFSRDRGPWIRGGAALWLAATLLATLGLGEHYLVDLIVAVPFAVGVHALGYREISTRAPERARPVVAGATLTALWIVVLRLIAAGHSPSAPLMAGLGLISLVVPSWLHLRLVRASPHAADGALAEPAKSPARAPMAVLAPALLFGAAAGIDLWIARQSLLLWIGESAATRGLTLAGALAAAALGALAGQALDARGIAPAKLLAHAALGLGIAGAAAPRLALVPVAFLAALPFPALVRRAGVGPPAAALMGAGPSMIAAVLGPLPVLGLRLSTLIALVLALFTALGALRWARHEHAPRSDRRPPPAPLLIAIVTSLAAPLLLAAMGTPLLAATGDSVFDGATLAGAAMLGLGAGTIAARHLLDRAVITASARLLALLAGGLALASLAALAGDLDGTFAAFTGYRAAQGFGAQQLARCLVIASRVVPAAAIFGALLAITAALRPRLAPPVLLSLALGAAATIAGTRDVVRADGTLEVALPFAPDGARPRLLGDDARRALSRSSGGETLVVIHPPPLGSGAAAGLFTHEAFSIAGEKLAPGGVLAVAIPLDRLGEDDLLAILATARAALPSLSIHLVGRRATLIACAGPCPARGFVPVSDRLLGPAETGELVTRRARVSTGSLVSTDDDLRLAFTVPRAVLSATREELLAANRRMLER